MKRKPKSFAAKLCMYFMLFATFIFCALWLLQIVFLQSFYDTMAITNVQRIAGKIANQYQTENIDELLDRFAYENALLVFVTDREGHIFYGTDEHSGNYQADNGGQNGAEEKDNPHRDPNETLSWQIGASRNLHLPQGYDTFLNSLSQSGDGTVGYALKDGGTYVYGLFLDENTILYISTALKAVGATADILRVQLLWVTAASLILAFLLALLISRRFARPVSRLSEQAKSMADGDFSGTYEQGFTKELDALSETLAETSGKLQKTEAFRREFLANISHDLRTPLTMIRGYAEMVQDISWEDEEKRNADCAVIVREADRLTGLVADILDYTELQSGAQTADLKAVDISGATRNVLQQFAPLCEKDGYHMETSIEPDLWAGADIQLLKRVLYNLIDNAVSHSDRSRKIKITLMETGHRIRTEIQDFGAGISPEDLPHIWDRYFTLKQKKRNAKGSGLGLAISKEILLLHNAQFGAQSDTENGTIFWFELKKHNK